MKKDSENIHGDTAGKKSRIALAVLFSLALVSTGCQKQEENIPITTVSQSTDDDDPQDNMDSVLSGEEIPEYEVDLPEDLSSFTLAIWGDTYQIPESYETFVGRGWEYSGDAEKEVMPESYSEGIAFEKDGNAVTVDIVNPDTAKKNVTECVIGGIHIDTATVEGQNIYVNLPGGIVMQQSLIEEAEEAYGMPKDRYEEEGLTQLTYEFGLYQTVTLGFDTATDTLTVLDIQNFRTKAGEDELENVSSAVPPEVEAYVAPAEEGASLEEPVVRYAGVLYALPVPVGELLDHDWTINEKESDRAVPNGKYGYVTLEKDGQKLFCTVHNYGSEPTLIRNCFVTSLYGDMDTTKVPISIAGGITLGTSEEELLTQIGDTKYEKEEKADNGTVLYTFYRNETGLDYTQITVDQALHLVRAIKVVENQDEADDTIPEEDTANQANESTDGAARET